MATCDASQLISDGKVFSQLSPNQLDIVELQLLCEIVAAGGGGGGGGGAGGEVGVVDPEGAVTAEPGTLYYNTANQTFWVKTAGSGDTGWQQLI